MGVQYVCKNERRRQAVRRHPTLNGIDYLEVLDGEAPGGSPPQRTLLVRCIKPIDALGLDAGNVVIEGGVRVTNIRVEWAAAASEAGALLAAGTISPAEANYLLSLPDPDNLLVVRTDAEGDYSTYRLRLVQDDTPHPAFDVLLAEIDFSFKVECPSEFDCQVEVECPPEPAVVPPIDYLAKDYASFRRLLLDRLAVVMPDWQDHSAADLGIAVVEVIAYAADYLSYYQDAAATEAYLGTARRRASVRRHARLLDYPMHDGCNARAWVHVEVDPDGAADGLTLQRLETDGDRTRLLTAIPAATVLNPDDFDDLRQDHRPEVFEPMYDAVLYAAHNRIDFYTWGDRECCLPKGATGATLIDDADNRLRLRPGDVLIFEEVRGPATGEAPDANPAHRHAVRLTHVLPEATLADEEDPTGARQPGPVHRDELFEQPIVEIEWMEADALPFPLCISAVIDEEGVERELDAVSVARGNVVLADHGRTIGEPDDPGSMETLDAPTGGRFYRPSLEEADVTHSEDFDAEAWGAFDPDDPRARAATEALAQNPRAALPVVTLLDDEGLDWRPQRDLLGSDRFDTHFVVEMDNDERARLRFGDNTYGKKPDAGQTLQASYRVGNGTAGNVGAGAIAHVVTDLNGVVAVRNPMPAASGADAEDLEEVRQYAPQAFRRQERAVTEADYADVAERHRAVDRAAATRRWTGSWHTMFVTVDRTGGAEVDRAFEDELTAWLDRYKLAGHDVEVEPPRLVPLDVACTVCVKPGYLRSDVKLALLEVFSSRDLPDGRRGFFHPDNFTFGQPVYLSRIIAAAMAVPGVRWVAFDPDADDPARFHRWGEEPNDELEAGMITMGRLEIAQLDNDPNQPENGKIEFFMEGGL